MVHRFINSADEMRWLREKHIPSLPVRFKSAIIHGSERLLTRVEVSDKRDPKASDKAVVYVLDTDNVLRRVPKSARPVKLDVTRTEMKSVGPFALLKRKHPDDDHGVVFSAWPTPTARDRAMARRSRSRKRGHDSLTLVFVPDGAAHGDVIRRKNGRWVKV